MTHYDDMADQFSTEELEPRFEMAPWIEIGPAPCECEQEPEIDEPA